MNTKRRRNEGNTAFFTRNVMMAQAAGKVSESVTIPFDTAKVRMQIQKTSSIDTKPKYNGLIGTMRTIAAEEGLLALWNGLIPGLQR